MPPSAPSAGPVRSFDVSGRDVVTTEAGARAHRLLVEHRSRLERRLYAPRPGVWCLVGNGLSNQTFVEGPDGLIAIDTGESVEEMRAALRELRTLTDRPVVAVMYTHFHYVGGTRAVFEDAGRSLPVFAHERVVTNLQRVAELVGPAYGRGLIEQFGINLPADGPDGLVHAGLGLEFRLPEHAPFTPGFEPPTITTGTAVVWRIAGLEVHVTPAPSDADDSLTIWFPELGVAVQNIVWPALFNVFAIRGEEYRDPRVLLAGIDHLRSLRADYMLGAHGPPMQGGAEIAARVLRYRDSIQFLWDQTVRGMNRGWTSDELAARVRLPDLFDEDFITSERYGVAEHHVRQIHNGLKGWFDGDPAKLFVTPPAERALRLIKGFGGYDVVRKQIAEALGADDLRWAIELASWLVKAPAPDRSEAAGDRQALADCLRLLAQRTPAANIRNWALTTARDLEGVASLARYRTHRLRREAVIADPVRSVERLRVMLDPDRALGWDHHIRLDFGAAGAAGLHLRNCVACPTDGVDPDSILSVSAAVWADLLTGRIAPEGLLAAGASLITGDAEAVAGVLSCFELASAQKEVLR